MNKRLEKLTQGLAANDRAAADTVGVLSTGERCFVALAANRYDLLPANYADPVEAWFRLEPAWRVGVCEWRGWPRTYAHG